jgi:hypothetical protein
MWQDLTTQQQSPHGQLLSLKVVLSKHLQNNLHKVRFRLGRQVRLLSLSAVALRVQLRLLLFPYRLLFRYLLLRPLLKSKGHPLLLLLRQLRRDLFHNPVNQNSSALSIGG